jgi:hypothetical protein
MKSLMREGGVGRASSRDGRCEKEEKDARRLQRTEQRDRLEGEGASEDEDFERLGRLSMPGHLTVV